MLFWANAIADLVEIQQAHVVVALEEGKDLTTLVSRNNECDLLPSVFTHSLSHTDIIYIGRDR